MLALKAISRRSPLLISASFGLPILVSILKKITCVFDP
jgi:hypothetical protein